MQSQHSLHRENRHTLSADRTIRTTAKWSRYQPQQILGNEQLLTMGSNRMLPLSFSGQVEFIDFCTAIQPSYSPACPQTLRNTLLPNRCKLLHQRVNDLIASATGVCITLDIWSSRNMQSFIGVTAHLCVNYKMEAVLLACRHMTGRHTAVNVLRYYQDIIAEYNLENKLVGIVTDNATNMCAAFNLQGQAVRIDNMDE